MHFGGDDVPEIYTLSENSKVVFIPCPYGNTTSYQSGTDKGPDAILDAANHMELFDEELKKEIFVHGVFTQAPMAVSDLSPEQMFQEVYENIKNVLAKDKFPILLGGEHSVSPGVVKAVSEKYNNVSVLHLDAHYDLRNEYEGSKHSHACAARRFLEYAPVVEVGVRSLCKDEYDFIKTKPDGLYIKDVYDILKDKKWREDVVANLSDNVYISLDLDVFDPSIMPSTGTPEPGGLTWDQVRSLIKIVSEKKNIVGFDVVELMPIDDLKAPDFMTAKLIYRIMGYVFG